MRVARRPRRPFRSTCVCQPKTSSVVRRWRAHASLIDSRPPRTAATTTALRDATQRWASGGGKLARVSAVPSGASTRRARAGEVIIKPSKQCEDTSRDDVEELRRREPKGDPRSEDRL